MNQRLNDDDPVLTNDRKTLRALESPQQRLPAEVCSEPGAARRISEVLQLGDRRALRVTTIPEKHMGVPVEVVEGSLGVMVAADGTEVSLQ